MTALLALIAFSFHVPADIPPAPRPFVITVVDDQTGRGVPLVELKTTNELRYVTDSAGVAAIIEPGLVGQTVFFHVRSHGYEYPKDGFGYRGKALPVTEGGAATIKLHRVNIAERLYRVIGEGIYRDSALAGRPVPIRHPQLNAQVFGSDSVLNAIYQGKLHWFWGDTNRPSYPLGNFHMPGAASALPGQGGLDPEVGVDLAYFTAPSGFALETAHLPGDGPTWLSGLAVVPDESGRERLVAGYAKIRAPMDTYEHGLVVFNPETHTFNKATTFPLDAPIRPTGHTYLARDSGRTYLYFTTPYPLARVPADFGHLKDIAAYEAYTCLATGSRLTKGQPPRIDRGPDDRARYAWRPNTPALSPGDEARLVREGHLKADEVLLALRDAVTGKSVIAHHGTVTWNSYRKRWVMILVEVYGTSMLGELWFAEADTPLGPWVYARKVVTHDKYSFYNPRQHPYFDKDGGRVIFFEGTYCTTFSGNTDPTPRYDYNQVMYKLDLSDPRLDLPVAVYRVPGGYATGVEHAASGPPVFFALQRPGEGTVPVGLVGGKLQAGEAAVKPLFHALPADVKNPPVTTRPLLADDAHPGAPAVCHVWRAVSAVRLPGAEVPGR